MFHTSRLLSNMTSIFLAAVSAAKDAAGNMDVQKLQQLQQMGQAVTDELSKKDD